MSPVSTSVFRAACWFCGTAVALGAFAAHGLESRLPADLLAVFEVAVRYQFFHGLALLACSLAPSGLWDGPWMGRACLAWCVGILIFSGSLYLLALTGVRWLGAVTPIGGVAFLLGWGFALLASRRPMLAG